MTASVVALCIWVVCAAATAMLPLRRQFAPGLLLLLSSLALVVWLAAELGWLAAMLAAFAILSMFRRPLAAMVRRAVWPGPAA
jgi:hypothetical protein